MKFYAEDPTLKDTSTICKKRRKSKFFVFWDYLSPEKTRSFRLLMVGRTAFKVEVFGQLNHDSCLWRHQWAGQREPRKNFRTVPLQNGWKNRHFNHYSGFCMCQGRRSIHWFSQNSISSQEISIRSKFIRTVSFESLWLDFVIYSLLSLSMESERRSITFWYLSVDKSRDIGKNIFQSLTVVIRKRKIGNKRTKWYLKFKHLLHSLQ